MPNGKPDIQIGGVYASRDENGRYGIRKVLDVFGAPFDTVHLRFYEETFEELPQEISSANLSVFVGHAPIATDGFLRENPFLLAIEPVHDEELEGFNIYLEATDSDAESMCSQAHDFLVDNNYPAALEWFSRAARYGSSSAMDFLGHMYVHGMGLEAPDLDQAIKWLRIAAERGEVEPMYQLGVMYFNGEGVHMNHATALRWYQRAAENGHELSMYYLATMMAGGQGCEIDFENAYHWYSEAAKLGNADAMFGLGVMHLQGEGRPADERRAIKWIKKASAKGCERANEFLASR